MRVSLPSIFAAGVFMAAAGAVAPAMAQDIQVHVMAVQLPGGAIEHIQYVGDVPPRVVLMPEPVMAAVPMVAADPFAALVRISAMMNQQVDAMMRQASVSSAPGSGFCSHTTRITFQPGEARPTVVSSTSGDCGSDRGPGTPSGVTVPAPSAAPHTLEVNAAAPARGAEPVQVAWNK